MADDRKDKDEARTDLILLNPADVARVTAMIDRAPSSSVDAKNTTLPEGYILLTPEDIERMTIGARKGPPPRRREKFIGRTGIEHEIDPDLGSAHDMHCERCGVVVGVRQLPKDGRPPAAIASGLLCETCTEVRRVEMEAIENEAATKAKLKV